MELNIMKKFLLISALLFSFNGWAEVMVYEGNNFKECKAIASIMTNNDADYNESMKTCNSLLPQAQHRQSLRPQWRGMDNNMHEERTTKEVNKPSCRPPNC
jgi:hypothetical protein